MKDKAYWNDYYSKNKEENASSFVIDNLDFIKKEKVLDVACGDGRNSLFLTQKGFSVEGLDYSLKAIEKCKEKACEKAEFKVQDLDFYLGPIQKNDSAIIIDYKASARLLDEIKKTLKVGGRLLIENYTSEFLKQNQNLDLDIKECYKPFELLKFIKFWNVLYYDEKSKEKVYAILEKPSY
jgi:tellurite methyltransferase